MTGLVFQGKMQCTGLPDTSTKGMMDVAAVTMVSFGRSEAQSSFKNSKKLAVSADEIVLQPMPCLLGYSQLKTKEKSK